MSTRIALVALMLVAMAGCGDSTGQGVDLKGKVYVSESVKPRALVEGTTVELRFTDDGRLIAEAGCNQMQGPVSLDDGKVSVAELGVTAMGCPKPELHEQDTWLAKLIEAKPSWKLDGANLVLAGSGDEIVLTPEQPASLEGTWTVDGLVAKDAASSVPADVKATVEFKNGNLSIDTGCNFKGGDRPYELSDHTIKAELGPVTDMACGDTNEVETALMQAFAGGGPTYEIDRGTLTLTGQDGAGVTLKK